MAWTLQTLDGDGESTTPVLVGEGAYGMVEFMMRVEANGTWDGTITPQSSTDYDADPASATWVSDTDAAVTGSSYKVGKCSAPTYWRLTVTTYSAGAADCGILTGAPK